MRWSVTRFFYMKLSFLNCSPFRGLKVSYEFLNFGNFWRFSFWFRRKIANFLFQIQKNLLRFRMRALSGIWNPPRYIWGMAKMTLPIADTDITIIDNATNCRWIELFSSIVLYFDTNMKNVSSFINIDFYIGKETKIKSRQLSQAATLKKPFYLSVF